MIEIFDENKEAVDCSFKDDFVFWGRDWNSEEKWSVTLKESIQYTNYLKRINGEKKYLDCCYN